jgi:hypothetical protein
MKNTNYFKSVISNTRKLYHCNTCHAKVICFAIIFLLLKPCVYAQVGEWEIDPSSSYAKTTTNANVGIGTNNPDGHTEIEYSAVRENGLIVSRVSTVTVIPGGGGNPTSLIPGFRSGTGSNTGLSINYNLATKLFDVNDAPLFLLRFKNSIYSTNPQSPSLNNIDNKLMFKSGCLGINSNNPRAELDVMHYGYNKNYPVAIFSMAQPLYVINDVDNGQVGENEGGIAAGGDVISNNTIGYTRHIQFVNYLSDNGFNNLSKDGDQGIFWTDGAGSTSVGTESVHGTNSNSGLVIAPWNHTLGGIRISNEGNVSIGIRDNFGYKLAVNGEIGCQKIHVEINHFPPDYVFNKEYKLLNIPDLEKFIKANKHLPEVPSATELLKNGMDLTEMNMLLLKKVEELTLYIIEQNKRIESLEKFVK